MGACGGTMGKPPWAGLVSPLAVPIKPRTDFQRFELTRRRVARYHQVRIEFFGSIPKTRTP